MLSRQIAQKLRGYETPFYLYDTALLRQTLESVVYESKKYGYKVHYAIKANYDDHLLAIIREYGLGIDCASGNELRKAIEAGFDPKGIVYAGVGKRDKELRYAIEQDILAINCESIEELELVDALAGEAGRVADVALRINPDIDPALEAIIMKAIAKNPADRFATAKDMRLALNDYLAGRPVNLGEGFTSAETVVMGGVVPPVGVADGTAVMPAMGGVSPASPTAAQRSYNANNTSGKKNNKKTIAIVIGIIAALAVVGGIAFALMSGSGNDKDKVAVPSVVGQTVDQATTAIEEAGFELGKVEESFDDKVESGKVISQDPKGDSKQAKGTKINLTVSKGVQEITVPDLTGMTSDQAQKALTASGLKYAKGAAEYSDTVEKDHVARQDVAAGENVAKDTVVTYYLSLGSEGIEVPNVVGMSRGNAVTTLNNAGLIVDTDNYTYEASDQPEGTVLSQTPAAGSKLKKDGLVALTLSKGPEKKTFSVAVNANGGGKISASASSVTEGDSVTITITPDNGFEVASASGLDDVPKSGGTFTISNVKANVNVNVTFQAVTPGPTPTPDPKPTDDTNKN